MVNKLAVVFVVALVSGVALNQYLFPSFSQVTPQNNLAPTAQVKQEWSNATG